MKNEKNRSIELYERGDEMERMLPLWKAKGLEGQAPGYQTLMNRKWYRGIAAVQQIVEYYLIAECHHSISG